MNRPDGSINSLMLRGQLKLDRFNKVSLARRFYLIGFIAPEGELLSFARPKESNQRKGRPVAACFLRSSLSPRVAKRDSYPFGNALHP
jgi:hypothetical protein